jgi:ATP-dependent RNA helicase DeaD
MDTTTTGDSDGGGCPHLFQSTARFDRVMGDAAYNRRHQNQAMGVTKTQQSTIAAGKGKQGDGWHDDGKRQQGDGKRQQGIRRHDDGDGRHDDGDGRHGNSKGRHGDSKRQQGDGRHDDGNGRHDDGKGQQGVRRHDDGDGRHDDGKGRQGGRATGGTTMATQSFAHLPGRKRTRATCIRM